MATGGETPEEGVMDHDLPNWSQESLEDRLNNLDWSGQKKANRSSEKNKKKLGMECEARLTNDISPGSSPGVGRRRTRTPHTYPHTRYMSQMSVPEQAELERLKQKINFGDLDQRSIGSDSQGRATAANNKRQLSENRKTFNFLPLQLNTNKDKDKTASPPKRETSVPSLPKDFLTSAFSKDLLQNFQASLSDDARGEAAIDSSQVVSRLVQIRNYISKASSMRDDLVEKNERSANVERLSNLIGHLKAQEKCYLKFLQTMLASENEEDIRTIDSAVGSGSVAESTSLNIDVQSEASDTTEVSLCRPCIEDNLDSSQMKVSEFGISTSSQSKGGSPAVSDRELWPCNTRLLQLKALDPQQEAKEELKNMKKQHALLTRILQQQEQLRALKGRQAALLSLQHKTEQAIAVMDDSVVTETTGSVSGLSLTSELNEELNDLIQRFHNQLHDVQSPPVPDNRRQAESLSLTREVSRSLNSSASEPVLEDRIPLFSKVGVLLEKKQKMDCIMGELHTLQDHHLNNTACSPQRGVDQRSTSSAASAPQATDNRAANSPAAAAAFPSSNSMNDSEDEENQNPAEKLKKLKEVRKRLNELRDLVRYYEQTSDMMTDAINENTKDDEEEEEEEEEETEDSWIESDQEVNQPVINIRNPQRLSGWGPVNSISNSHCGNNNRDERPLNTDCEINNRSSVNLRTFNVSSGLECLFNRELRDEEQHCNVDLDDEDADDQESVISLSSRSSVTEEGQTAEYEEKFNRLISAKHKLKQLQDLIAMYDGDTESETMAAERSASGGHSLPEEANSKQQPNNTRPNASKTQRDVSLKEQAREKFYESKLQQQQKELKQLQEERKKLIEIQEKIQTLRKACPDLQLSSSSSFKSGPTTKNLPTASSTPDVNVSNAAAIPSMPDPEDSSSVDNEVWSEIRRHQILREDLRQRRKQLESLMAEHQRRQGVTDTTSAGSIRSDDSEAHGLHHQSRTEKTMATWGGSTQCALDEDDEDDGCISDVNQVEDEEEEEQEETFHENMTHPQNSINQSACTGKNSKQGWNDQHPYAVDGNYRPSPSTKQQQNISMRRQENLRWVSELSQVEEKQLWQEQIDQIKRQLDFSTNMCQTLMRDQQSLHYFLQSMFTNPYNMMPSNLGTSQVPLIMHQLNQCFTQLNWQQNNVLRLKQMLSDVMRQQQQEPMQQNSQQRKPQESGAAPSAPPNVFDQFGCLPPPMNVFSMPPFGNFPNMVPGVNFNPVFPPGIGDLARTSTSQTDVPLQSHDPNTSGKTEYMAFPKPFESNSSSAGDRQSTTPKLAEGERNKVIPSDSQSKDEGKKASSMDAAHSASGCSFKHSEAAHRVRQFDEESMDSLSSMPDPGDPTTVTKTFKSRKASAQASLASKDKTPKTKNKKRKISHQKNRGLKNLDLQSASASSIAEPKESSNKHAQTEETGAGNAIAFEHLQRLRKDSKAADLSSEAGSDFSMFEALRDTIYSEVATLISQNECRPHFLIELFHELQLLSTDYLRQKALFALQDIVTRRVTENTEKLDCSKPLDSVGWMASNSELTPSESLATTDDEMFAKDCHSRNEGEQNDADNISTLSTSSNFEPFAIDDLGNTVIHLDQALARMREYERMKIEAENSLDAECCNKLNNAASNVEEVSNDEGEHSKQCSDEGSAVPCPHIDIQQLDRQIKAIMKEVIPFLKEHMEEVCSSHLLTSIRRMVLTLTQQNDESKEFVKFFHKQLGSILQDSLEKFSNKKLKDCGEDLLVEISEVLFNELAFFRLMQDLDNNSSSAQSRGQHRPNTDVLQSLTKKARKMLDGVESSDSKESDDEDKDKDETEISKSQNKRIDVSEARSGRSDISEEEDGNENIPVSISLSKSETQALTNYGSGEDENDEEEENYEFEARPVDVQTSLEANAETTDENAKEQALKNPINEPESENLAELCIEEAEDVCKVKKNPELSADNILASLQLQEGGMSASADRDAKSSQASAESSGPGSPATDSPVLVNEFETGSGNLSQKSDEDDFVKVEDLPLKLALPKAELMAEMENEQLNNNLCNEILNGQGNGVDDLAGDALLLKEPESNGSHSG